MACTFLLKKQLNSFQDDDIFHIIDKIKVKRVPTVLNKLKPREQNFYFMQSCRGFKFLCTVQWCYIKGFQAKTGYHMDRDPKCVRSHIKI